MTTLAGTAGLAGYVNDTGAAARFRFTTPSAAVVDGLGNVYVADTFNNAIRKITSGGVVSTFAGSLTGLPGSANGNGTSASFSSPQGLAIDGLGNLYVADTGNHMIRMITSSGNVTTLAGTAGILGYANGTGAAARFWSPVAVAVDRPGGGAAANVFVADTQNNVIRRIAISTGEVTTLAGALPGVGGGAAPAGSTNGLATEAQFRQPQGIVSDSAGVAIFVADTGNHMLRRITWDGVNANVTLLAGSGSPTYAEGSGTGASFNTPTGIMLDASSTLLVADTLNQVIRSVTSFGTTSVFAGSPMVAGSANGLATGGALFDRPTGVAMDVFGVVYVVDTINSTVRRIANAALPLITSQPIAQTVALGGTATFSVAASGAPTPTIQWQRFRLGDPGFISLSDTGGYTGTNTATLTISPVTTAMAGDLYQAVVTNSIGAVPSNSVQLTVSLGTIYSTWVGLPGVSGAVDAAGTSARFRALSKIATDTSGNVYVADTGNHVIRKVTPTGEVTTIAGFPGIPGSADGLGNAARFSSPAGVAVSSAGVVYVADTGNQTIRMITPFGLVTTVAGTPGILGSVDGEGALARFAFPSAIAVDAGGNLYVADNLSHTIRKITGTTVTTLAGLANAQGAVDASGSSARFAFPTGVAVDAAANVYVADSGNHLIRKISPAGVVTTIAGLATVSGTADGNGTTARFNQPRGIWVDGTTVYVADTGNHTIRTISAQGDVVTIAGTPGVSGSADGALNTARFSSPLGVAVSGSTVYIADTQNHVIRRTGAGTPAEITVQPADQRAALGGSATFTVTATGAPLPALQWQRRAAGTSTFVNLSNDGSYGGVTTSALTVSGISAAMAGDEFRVVANNVIGPVVISNAATLLIGDPPVFTSANQATFRAEQANTFTVAATSVVPVTFSATGLPSWATLDPTTGVLSGTPPNTSGSPFAVVITASAGASSSMARTQDFTLIVEPAQMAPAITTQPVGINVNRGDSPTFTVSAVGTPPLSYQWRRNGAAIGGATSSSFTVPNAQAGSAGAYTVTVSNAFGSVTSNAAMLTVNTAPFIATQPQSQTALAGTSVTFAAEAGGASGLTYQWRRNGVAIAGATNSTLTVGNILATDAGNYDVVITNALGNVMSSVAQLSVATGPTAPVFTLQPASRTTTLGGAVTLAAAATGVPAPTYQWRRNGVALSGATNATLVIGSAQASDAGSYDVVATSTAGSTTSAAGTLRIIARSYAGIYFGSFAGNLGTFALMVRDDNSGIFLGYLPGSTAPVLNLSLSVNDAGQFSFSQSAIAATSARDGEPARAAALAAVTVGGTIGSDGSVNGSISGGASASFSGSRIADTGATQALAGYYQAGGATSAAITHLIVSADGRAFLVAQSGTASDGGTGTASAGGQVSVATSRSAFTGTISPANGTVAVVGAGAVAGSFSGGSEQVLALQRLLNISSRARVAAGDAVAIAGFVIAGNESKPVLIRAVGPTLGEAPFGVPGVLSNPKLDLHRLLPGGPALVATNSGIGASRAAIDAAGVRIGAFALGSSGADAAILTTLAPGNYTATVSSVSANTGVALIEVYDLSAAAAGQKLLNISTRATAGSAENTLIAGVVVSGSAPKRVLVRAVGPGLAVFGVSGVLAQPTLTLYNQSSQAVAVNTGWSTSSDAAAIGSASTQVGAFPLATGDSAMIVTLAPGNYTAQVTGAGTATGVALIEVYELP